jgi:hypothetical protein
MNCAVPGHAGGINGRQDKQIAGQICQKKDIEMNTSTNHTAATRLARTLAFAAATLAFVAGAGCSKMKKAPDSRIDGAAFRPEGEERTVNKFIETQVASGSRRDGTLRSFHFDHDSLNSLGRKKLDEMLRDDDIANPLVVYLDAPQDRLYTDRQTAIQEYLTDRGLNGGQIKVVAGQNLDYMNATGPALRAKKALDSGTANATNPEPTGSPSNAPAASAGK